jgi:hypothetical protein
MDKHKDMLNFLLSDVPVSQKSKLLKNVKEHQAKILSEIVVNILYGILPISDYYKRRMEPFKKIWNSLAKGSKLVRKKTIANNPKIILLVLKACRKKLKDLIGNGIPENDSDTYREVQSVEKQL